MADCFACLYYHNVFSTKNRQPLLTADIRQQIYDYIGGIVRKEKGVLISVGGAEDHTHLLTSLYKTHAIVDDIRTIKAGSSVWIKETFPELSQFAWQDGYGAFSVSYQGLDRVKAYIAQQVEHHRTVTFKEEFIDFLARHGIEYDERYLWD
ncbi:MAG: IS200/IS605 family transposase [Armatimonadota bacterium]